MPLDGKSILVTGGTGSFGREFAIRVFERFKPKRLVVFSRDELKQSEMRKDFPETDYPNLSFVIGNVRDRDQLRRSFEGMDIVVHAAALKQIPSCEFNAYEAVQTNIIGAQNVVDAALRCDMEKVLFLSTDKAVSPVSLYGATKLCAERLILQGSRHFSGKKTLFSCSRYGNVTSSRGSVVPLFLEQRKTGKVTLTDPNMTRFWMTIGQGVDFVVQNLENMTGGEIYIPKVPSIRIADLAESLAPGCEVEIIGIRPGEKLHELLISEDEGRLSYEFDDYFVIRPTEFGGPDSPGGNGGKVKDGFVFSSNENKMLSVEEIREMSDWD